MVSKKQTGFTIVELLIVIVVIGILAAIVIVAYSGVQNRANDAAVMSDLKSDGKKMHIYQTLNIDYPNLTQLTDPATQLTYSKNSYSSAIYCKNVDHVILVGQSKSGNAFYYDTSIGTVKTVVGDPTKCATFNITSADTAYDIHTLYSGTTWSAWAH